MRQMKCKRGSLVDETSKRGIGIWLLLKCGVGYRAYEAGCTAVQPESTRIGVSVQPSEVSGILPPRSPARKIKVFLASKALLQRQRQL